MDKQLFDFASETAVLSTIIKNPQRIYEAANLKPDMFSSKGNQLLFQAMTEVAENGLIPEPTLLVNYLLSKNRLEECGGESYVKYLFNSEYDPTNFTAFVRIVTNSYKARTVLQLASQIPSMVTNVDSIDEIISSTRNTLDNLTGATGGEKVSTLYDASKEMWNNLITRVKSDNKIQIPTGFKSLDAITGGYQKGDVWIVAGRPSMGKSAWLCNSVLNSAKQGIPSLLFSLEMQKDVIVQRLVSIDCGISVSDMALGMVTQGKLDQIQESIKRIKDLPIYIDTDYSANISYIASTIRKYVNLYNIKVVHIDYIQLLVDRGMYTTQELGKVSRDMKLLSNELSINTVIYSQLNRLVEARDDKRPVLSDLRQSGNLEEDADKAIFLYRDELYNQDTKNKGTMEFLIRKFRNGPLGVLFYTFVHDTNRIYDK